MDLRYQKVNSCKDLLAKSLTFTRFRTEHNKCGRCYTCLGNSFNIDAPVQDTMSIPEILNHLASYLNNSKTSPVLSMVLEKTVKCSCSYYEGVRNLHFQELTITEIGENSLLHNLISFQLQKTNSNYCASTDCKIRNSHTSYHLLNDPQTYFISITWTEKSLKTLFKFLKSITQQISLNLYKKSNTKVKYLQGFIVEGANSYTYINLNPCEIGKKSGRFEGISFKLLFFLLLQYGLFPVLLVYDDEVTDGWEQEMKNLKAQLFLYSEFLCREKSLAKCEICFYCFGLDHENCEVKWYKKPWICKNCEFMNSESTVFCEKCNAGRRKSQISLLESCKICCKPSPFIYCQSCSIFAHCQNCSKDLLRTQPFYCPHCKSCLKTFHCESCQIILTPQQVLCLSCKSLAKSFSAKCPHNQDKLNCQTCMYEFNCAVCRQNKVIFNAQFCWCCRYELTDGTCGNCEKIIPKHSLICEKCVVSQKKCEVQHIITKQSISVCKSCQKENSKFCGNCTKLKGACCKTRVFCKNCPKEITSFSDNKCEKCAKTVNLKCESCNNNPICQDCFNVLKSCSCGCKLLDSQTVCPNCSQIIFPISHLAPSNLLVNPRDWTCKYCNFSNGKSFSFCENCNLSQSLNFIYKKQCGMCLEFHNSDLCGQCFTNSDCSHCLKKILSGQGVYCKNCGDFTWNRVCRTCRSICSKSEIICFLCSCLFWTCRCMAKNKENSLNCKNCGGEKLLKCVGCREDFFDIGYWRGPGPKSIYLHDVFCCSECRRKLGQCRCGAKVLGFEKICKSCGIEL